MPPYKGRFVPRNPEKYKGNPTNIVYRSSWELKFMGYLDKNPNVLQWASEEVAIPYRSPLDNKWHRYFPDFIVRMRDADGKTVVKMIEIKPMSQSVHPEVRQKGQRITKKYLREVATYGINNAKWEAAKEFCADRNWEFVVLTEKNVNFT
jgi:hypothetical protein